MKLAFLLLSAAWLALVVAAAAAFYRFRSSLGKLRKSAEAIGRGDFSISVLTDERGHLGDFARVFDGMRVDLAQAALAIREVAGDRDATQERYKIIYERTGDPIFTILPNLQITAANPAAARLIGTQKGALKGKNFFDLVSTENQGSLAPVILMKEFAEFIENRGSMARRMVFRRLDGKETPEYDVRLEFLNVEGVDEIIARAVPVRTDALLHGLVKESLSFEMKSDLLFVDTLAQRLSRNVPRYCAEEESFNVTLGVREMLINAIEHGNLGITHSEKSAAMSQDMYLDLLQERARNPAYGSKVVWVEYELDAQKVRYRITDQGRGFDHKSFTKQQMPDVRRPHGRGILITSECFDSVTYNETGNSVELIRFFPTA